MVSIFRISLKKNCNCNEGLIKSICFITCAIIDTFEINIVFIRIKLEVGIMVR